MGIKPRLKDTLKKTTIGLAVGASLLGGEIAEGRHAEDKDNRARQEQRVEAEKTWEEAVAEHDRLPALPKKDEAEISEYKSEIVTAKMQIKKWFEMLRNTPGIELPALSAIEGMEVRVYDDFTIRASAADSLAGIPGKEVKNPVEICFFGKTSVFDGSIGKDSLLSFFPKQKLFEISSYRMGDVEGKKVSFTEEDFYSRRGIKRVISLKSNGDLSINSFDHCIKGTILDEPMPHFSVERGYETDGPYAYDIMDVSEYWGDLGPETCISRRTEYQVFEDDDEGKRKVVKKEKEKRYKGCASCDLHPGLRVIKMEMGPRK